MTLREPDPRAAKSQVLERGFLRPKDEARLAALRVKARRQAKDSAILRELLEEIGSQRADARATHDRAMLKRSTFLLRHLVPAGVELGVSAAAQARMLGVSRQALSELLKQ
jgi:hypothetical protein